MKKLASLRSLIALLLLVAGCVSPKSGVIDGADLPPTRPADFEIGFHEFGAPRDPSAEYRVKPTESSYKTTEDGVAHSWVVRMEAAELDALYAKVLESGVTHMKSEVEAGENQNRFGYELELKWEGHTFVLADQGDRYIQKEADYNKFMDVIAEVRATIGQGLQSQMYAVKVNVFVDPKLPATDSVSVDLEEKNLIDLPMATKPGDTLWGESKVLRGMYLLKAQARIDGKMATFEKSLDLVGGPNETNLLLTAKGFQLK